jgi:hypothetical protein
MGLSGEIFIFLFLRTPTDSGLSEVEVSDSFIFSKFSKITSRNTLGLMLKFSNLNEKIEKFAKNTMLENWNTKFIKLKCIYITVIFEETDIKLEEQVQR